MGKKKKKVFSLYPNLAIENAGSEGKCIGRADGKVIMVDYAVPGDVADVQVYEIKKRFEFAKITQLHTPSADRIETFCTHFGTCGGCKWQQMSYAAQLKYKQQQVQDAFERLGKFPFPAIQPILGSTQTVHYRNKVEYSFTDRKWLTNKEDIGTLDTAANAGLGYHIPGRFDKVFEVSTCHLMPPLNDEIRNSIGNFCKQKGYSFYNLYGKSGLMRNLMLRNNSKGEWMLLVSFGEDKPEEIQTLMQYIQKTFPQITSLLYVINTKLNDTFHDLPIHLFAGKPYLVEELEGTQFKIGPKSFFQTNTQQTLTLYHAAREMAALTGKEKVYDLYTGVGTIALFVAAKAKEVIGIEYVPQAIEDAKENAALNNINHTQFFAGDMKELLTPAFIETHGKPDVVITDPPRAGMHEDVITRLLEMETPRIVYVSCNPATQARDIALLTAKYQVTKVQPVDMFPHTHHVENIALLELR